MICGFESLHLHRHVVWKGLCCLLRMVYASTAMLLLLLLLQELDLNHTFAQQQPCCQALPHHYLRTI